MRQAATQESTHRRALPDGAAYPKPPPGPDSSRSVSIAGFDKSPSLCYSLRRFRMAAVNLASRGRDRETKYAKEVLFDGQ